MVCELLAIKLLKEYSARELIDALSYDFDPLQGRNEPETPGATSRADWTVTTHRPVVSRAPRISCLEVAIRAQAKRFLAHPLVVQQLEAIWAGSIVFHAVADNLHRPTKRPPRAGRGKDYRLIDHEEPSNPALPSAMSRRSVTLYDPSDASLFKLSRLRVPRYRFFLSTCSFAVLLALFLAVLIQKSVEITSLEVVFWFWSAGFILDEIVTFNEQGFNLYLASFWNTFDLGILLLLIVHLCLRLYGIIMPDASKAHVASLAYDVLAADAVLLFPRLFSVLDHYRYFSQLLIAFRMMALDLVAVFVLILISCSGFFVALTLSFGNQTLDSPASVAYTLFQILLGFTPAAWDRWDGYNALGKTILTLFLFICHFLVVTILISVLTNSFMAIVQNANEEHQFVFAVNTISMVKSDALFSYVAPTNIIAWLITPLRYFVTFSRFIRINRTIIKITHFPVLLTIFLYEKSILKSSLTSAVESIEPRGRSTVSARENGGIGLFTPQLPSKLRETSVATWRKDRALEAVFRRPTRGSPQRDPKSQTRQRTNTAVNQWMQNLGESVLSPPQEQDHSIADLPAKSRFARRRRDLTDVTRSVASDPEDFGGFPEVLSSVQRVSQYQTTPSQGPGADGVQHTDADGDDELVTSDNDEDDDRTTEYHTKSLRPIVESPFRTAPRMDYFSIAPPRRPVAGPPHSSPSVDGAGDTHNEGFEPENRNVEIGQHITQRPRHRPHLRNVSSATIIYNPVQKAAANRPDVPDAKKPSGPRPTKPVAIPPHKSGVTTPATQSLSTTPSWKVPAKATQMAPSGRVRPKMPFHDSSAFMSTPNLAGLMRREKDRRRSSLTIGLGSDIGDNKAIGGGFVGAIPASFATQMGYGISGRDGHRRKHSSINNHEDDDDEDDNDDRDMFGRLVLTRMNKLEEGFKEVIHEMRESRLAVATSRGGIRTNPNTNPNNSPVNRSPNRVLQGTTSRSVPRHHARRSIRPRKEKERDKERGRPRREGSDRDLGQREGSRRRRAVVDGKAPETRKGPSAVAGVRASPPSSSVVRNSNADVEGKVAAEAEAGERDAKEKAKEEDDEWQDEANVGAGTTAGAVP